MTTTTEAQILAAFEEAGHEYIDIEDLTFTQDTIEDFKAASKNWAECKGTEEVIYGGFAAIEFDSVQVSKGQQRHALTVIDFGDVRASYK